MLFNIRVQSQSNKPKKHVRRHHNFIKLKIFLKIFVWYHFNAMFIMECSVKWLIWMLKISKIIIWVLVLIMDLWTWTTIASKAILQITKLNILFIKEFWDDVKLIIHTQKSLTIWKLWCNRTKGDRTKFMWLCIWCEYQNRWSEL